jgi:hypothetical protein
MTADCLDSCTGQWNESYLNDTDRGSMDFLLVNS